MKGALLLALLVMAPLACAQGLYYADVVFDVDSAGSVAVSGTANHPLLAARATDSLTSKRGSFWLFNLTLPEGDAFSNFVFDIRLPEGASVSYAKTSGQFRITSDGGRIAVKGVGANEPFFALVQYQIAEEEGQDYVLPGVAAAIMAALVFFVWKKRAKKSVASEDISYDPDLLTDRQKDIMRVIKDEGKPINQTLVCERLNLPKSSVSRNVDSLERMGLIRKTRNGMSTMVSLKD